MSKCNRLDCTSGLEATLSPVIMIYLPKEYGSVPILSHMTLEVCKPCSKKIVLADILTDEGWARIVAGVYKAGKMMPDRSRTQLSFETIDKRKAAFSEMKKADPSRVRQA